MAPSHLEPVSIVVLAKESREAKTRLAIQRADARRIALWLAASTVRKVRRAHSVGSVLVVTTDEAIALDACEAGAIVVPEERPIAMNRAAALGRRHALSISPSAPVGILVADLPHLRPEDVDGVIAEFRERKRALFVADHHGEGTTFLIQDPDSRLGVAFGRRSAHVHSRLGYEAARRPLRGLRVDLDTPEDLRAVVAAGPRVCAHLNTHAARLP